MKDDAYPDLDCCDPVEWGLDLSLVESNLQLTPTERWERHAAALELAMELRRAGNATLHRSPPGTPR